MADYTFRDARESDEPEIRALVFAILDEHELAPDPCGADADLDDVMHHYFGRGGTFRLLVSESGHIVGCGGLYPLSTKEAEVRKMYFAPHVRGRGLGRVLLTELIAFARAHGFQRVVLETASVLNPAISLYTRFGFQPVQRDHAANRCDQAFALDLYDQVVHGHV